MSLGTWGDTSFPYGRVQPLNLDTRSLVLWSFNWMFWLYGVGPGYFEARRTWRILITSLIRESGPHRSIHTMLRMLNSRTGFYVRFFFNARSFP